MRRTVEVAADRGALMEAGAAAFVAAARAAIGAHGRFIAALSGGSTPRALEAELRAIPGVVDTGLFLGTAERVLVGYPDGRVDVLQAER